VQCRWGDHSSRTVDSNASSSVTPRCTLHAHSSGTWMLLAARLQVWEDGHIIRRTGLTPTTRGWTTIQAFSCVQRRSKVVLPTDADNIQKWHHVCFQLAQLQSGPKSAACSHCRPLRIHQPRVDPQLPLKKQESKSSACVLLYTE
jgi:hypothetical protein